MSQITKTISLEQPENLRLQDREARWERWAWMSVALLLVGATLGLFGPGPLSQRTRTSQDGRLTVEFYSVGRHESPSELRINFQSPAASDLVQIMLSRSFVDVINDIEITPAPRSVAMHGDWIVYAFSLTEPGSEGTVLYRYSCKEFGQLQYQVALMGESTVDISQFTCP